MEKQGQVLQIVSADQNVDRWRTFEDLVTLKLSHASAYGDLEAGRFFLEGLVAAHRMKELLGCTFAHRARVHEDHIGALGRLGANKAIGFEQTRGLLRVVDVHLTTERLDEVLPPGHGSA